MERCLRLAMESDPTSSLTLPPGYIEKRTDDVEALFNDAAGEHWELEYLQLTPGPLGGWYRIVPLPEMTLHWYRCSAKLHVREHHRYDGVYLAFQLSPGETIRWRGTTLQPDQALLYHPGQDHDYVLPEHLRSMGFTLSYRLLRQLGWRLPAVPILRIDNAGVKTLVDAAARITAGIRQGTLIGETAREIAQERLALLLDRLLIIDQGDRDPVRPDRLYRIADAARHLMLEREPAGKLDVRQLAAALSTSTRNLYRAFQHCFGVGPYEYHTLLRFRAFREGARTTAPYPGIITELAVVNGFTHLGRFAAAYQRQYGERPRDTLRRWLRDGCPA